MNNIHKSVLGLVLTTVLSSCGSSTNNSDPAPGQNVQIMTKETSVTPSRGAFDPAESKMGEEMSSAIGSNTGDNWVRKMIAHHQGAVDMSKVVLGERPSAEVAQMAKMTIDKQGHEIEDLKKLEGPGAPDQKSADLFKPAMTTMQQAMMGATGSTVSETFLRKMLAHHEGAIAMSDIALKSGLTGAIKTRAEKVRADQQKEADSVKAMIAKP